VVVGQVSGLPAYPEDRVAAPRSSPKTFPNRNPKHTPAATPALRIGNQQWERPGSLRADFDVSDGRAMNPPPPLPPCWPFSPGFRSEPPPNPYLTLATGTMVFPSAEIGSDRPSLLRPGSPQIEPTDWGHCRNSVRTCMLPAWRPMGGSGICGGHRRLPDPFRHRTAHSRVAESTRHLAPYRLCSASRGSGAGYCSSLITLSLGPARPANENLTFFGPRLVATVWWSMLLLALTGLPFV
jgi:hypothetical protein